MSSMLVVAMSGGPPSPSDTAPPLITGASLSIAALAASSGHNIDGQITPAKPIDAPTPRPFTIFRISAR